MRSFPLHNNCTVDEHPIEKMGIVALINRCWKQEVVAHYYLLGLTSANWLMLDS